MEKEWLILVDTEDREIGTMSKEDAHRLGKLHRAFSVFLYDGDKMLTPISWLPRSRSQSRDG